MPETTLAELLTRNARHTNALAEGYFDDVVHGQSPAAVSICCSDARVSQEGMWDVDEPGWLFTPSTIGNQVWDLRGEELIVDGSVLYPLHETDTDVAVVVGHTGCGAITAALAASRTGTIDAPAGIRTWIELLIPVVEAGMRDPRVDPEREASLVDQLVEYNVDRQVAFLRESDDVPARVSIYGFVFDLRGVYGAHPGRAYLVNVDGEIDVEVIRSLVPDTFADHVHRLV